MIHKLKPKWEDQRVPMHAVKTGGLNDPNFAQYKTNGAGSTGVYLWMFDDMAEEELFFVVQLSHGYVEGSNIRLHIHWVATANGAAGTDVCWGLEYTWQNESENKIFSNTTLIYKDVTRLATDPLIQDTHYKTQFDEIDGTDKTISSMLICRMFRDATGVGGTDDYAHDAGLLEIDFHILKDARGSNEEYKK